MNVSVGGGLTEAIGITSQQINAFTSIGNKVNEDEKKKKILDITEELIIKDN